LSWPEDDAGREVPLALSQIHHREVGVRVLKPEIARGAHAVPGHEPCRRDESLRVEAGAVHQRAAARDPPERLLVVE